MGGEARKDVTLSINQKRTDQILGFFTCLQALLIRYRITVRKDKYLEFLKKEFKNIELDELPKIFKLSLATFFSRENCQQLPEDHKRSIKLFPKSVMDLIYKIFAGRRPRKLRFCWDLLQCKDLAHKVPDEMIQKAYEKHQKILSSVGKTKTATLEHLRVYFRDFCEKVKFEFENKSTLPPRSAYLNSKKSEGGCLKYFVDKKKITGHIFERRSVSNDSWRIDPVVIHLTGKPGVGKSYMVEKIASQISRAFGFNTPNVYQRSIATDHWDGYRNQLISVIDDAFSSPDASEDHKQIIQICSNVPTVLPMADLKEKGRMFTSDFIIITSNNPTHQLNIQTNCVVNADAFLRRIFAPAYKVEGRTSDGKLRVNKLVFDQEIKPESNTMPNPLINTKTVKSAGFQFISSDDLVKQIVDESIALHRIRARHEDFIVPVTNNGPFGSNIGYKIPITPPDRLPIVQAHAIPEPLKVRMITKAEEDCWVLKPVQKAMWKALSHYKCFELTHTPTLPLDFIDSWKGRYLLSGDYESATDNLNQDIMQLFVDELVKVLPIQYRDWVKFEAGSHVVTYPKSSGLSDIIQTRGQLMGSLLSFPVLCVANAACLAIIKDCSLEDLPALVNGDDILFRADSLPIRKWKTLTKSIGLKPSIGKNYQHRLFGSINSQLLVKVDNKHQHVGTGCFGAVSKVSNFVQNLSHALRIEPENKAIHVKRAAKLLKQTPQSIDVPVSHGGLGVEFLYPQTQKLTVIQNEIYLFKLLREKCKLIQNIDDHCIMRVPKHLLYLYKNVLDSKKYQEVPELELEDLDLQVFPMKEFHRFVKWYRKIPVLRERINAMHLPKEVPLNLLKTVTIKIHKQYKPLLMNLRLRV